MMKTAIWFSFIIGSFSKTFCSPLDHAPSTFRAAVYEHAVVFPDHSDGQVVSRETALDNMMVNLEVYREQAIKAGQQNVSIMVFPEGGIYGVDFDRQKLEPYLEFIPDPKYTAWNPCDDPARYPHTEVQFFLSCLAKNNSLFLVANFGDRQPCSQHTDPRCPDDGHYQYNTNVVYNPSGTFIARYHKVNLFYEFQFDFPNVSEAVTFTTPFGVFGVFTCFDIIFHDPVIDLIKTKGVRNIAFPTAWMDALPLLSSIQFHSAFAVGNRLNFLAANINYPERRFHGSGIYTPSGAKTFYYNDRERRGKLLIADIPTLGNDDQQAVTNESQIREQSHFRKSELAHRRRPNGVGRGHLDPIRAISSNEFQSPVFHDIYNFRSVDESRGNITVCHNQLCCDLSYEKENSSDKYAFGAFDGLHTYEGSYYIQVCVLLKCNGTDDQSCGEPTFMAQTNFWYLRMTGNFRSSYVFPEVLLCSNGSLALSMGDRWSYGNNIIESPTGLENAVLTVALFSRVYTDMDSNGGHGGA